MKVWRLDAGMKGLVINLKNYEEDREKIHFNGAKIENWEKIDLESTVNHKKQSDMVCFTAAVPVFSERACSMLQQYIANDVQYLPVNHERELVFVNVTNVIDCIDYKRSVLRKNPWNVFNGFERIYFTKDKIEDQYIFKTPELVNTYVFVTDKFKEVVEQSKLKDFDFIEIWDSELTPEIEAERLTRFESKLAEINASPIKVSWSAACQLVEDGKAVVSGEWKLQRDKYGTTMLGVLTMDLTYIWSNPVYYPPILLTLDWCEVESSDI